MRRLSFEYVTHLEAVVLSLLAERSLGGKGEDQLIAFIDQDGKLLPLTPARIRRNIALARLMPGVIREIQGAGDRDVLVQVDRAFGSQMRPGMVLLLRGTERVTVMVATPERPGPVVALALRGVDPGDVQVGDTLEPTHEPDGG